jgi:hypothetical protein
VLPSLEKFVRVRNQYSHGGKPRVLADVESAARGMTELVSMVLDSVEPLTNVRFGAVRKSDRSPRSQHYEIDLDVMALEDDASDYTNADAGGHADIPASAGAH